MRRRSSRRGGRVVPFLLGFLTGRLTLRRLGGIVAALWLGAWLVLNTWQGQLVLVVGVAVAFLLMMNKAGFKGLSWPSRNPLDSSPLLDVPRAVYRYRRFDRDRPEYIGSSSHPSDRHLEHVRDGRSFTRDPLVRCWVEWYATQAEGFAAEKEAIERERPVENVVWNGPGQLL